MSKSKNNNNILAGGPIYIVGHKKPDLDSIASAFAYQYYRHAKGDFNYIAIRCDGVNNITKWVFSHFNQEVPMYMNSIANKKVVLVDHTDPEQRPDGWEKAEIIEVVDHHRLSLETTSPPKITVRPYGSTATLIAQKFLENQMNPSRELAGIMLAAILDDTLALRSPVTTYVDKMMAGEMSARSGVGNLPEFTKKLFSKKDTWHSMPVSKIINTDVKEIKVLKDKRVIVSQVETMNPKDIEKREKDIMETLKSLEKKEPTALRMLMLTDLLSNSCNIFAVGEKTSDLEQIFSVKLVNNHKLFLPGVLSRKKQIFKPILNFYSK